MEQKKKHSFGSLTQQEVDALYETPASKKFGALCEDVCKEFRKYGLGAEIIWRKSSHVRFAEAEEY